MGAERERADQAERQAEEARAETDAERAAREQAEAEDPSLQRGLELKTLAVKADIGMLGLSLIATAVSGFGASMLSRLEWLIARVQRAELRSAEQVARSYSAPRAGTGAARGYGTPGRASSAG
jgi:hypothetical protein